MLYDSYNLIYLYGLNGYLKWEYNGDIYIYIYTNRHQQYYIWIYLGVSEHREVNVILEHDDQRRHFWFIHTHTLCSERPISE